MKQLLLDIKPLPLPTLDNFLPGRNAELLHMLTSILSNDEKERFVYLWGGLGCGKSHLLQATVAAYTQRNSKAVYCRASGWAFGSAGSGTKAARPTAPGPCDRRTRSGSCRRRSRTKTQRPPRPSQPCVLSASARRIASTGASLPVHHSKARHP